MLKNKFNDIFHNIQQNESSHQKYHQVLLKIYKEVPLEDFEIELMRCTELLLCKEITPTNVFVNRSLDFIGTFVGCVMNEGAQLETNNANNNAFLENILTNIICYHNLDNVAVRYHCCKLIHVLFSSLGEHVLIDSELWDLVTDPLLERLKDIKPNVRVQAAQALSRFQLPNEPTCKVVSAFIDRLYDINALVRKEIVFMIAPTKLTFPKIAERVKDTDPRVRSVAFRKCATIGPKVFMINTRQSILMNGFNERNAAVKTYFQTELLPSWLNSYKGDYLKFLDALKLDSCEEDIKHSEIVCNNVLMLFFKTHQLKTILENFILDDNKVIPIDKLNYQSSLLWYCLVEYIRGLDNSEDQLELIIPDLTLFCAYIERVVEENCKVEGWKFFEHQHNLLQLFKIAKTYDFSDEVGRKCLRKLVIDLLTTKKLSERVTLTMITILSLINPNLDLLTTDICHIISEIREPMVEVIQPTESEIMQRNYQLAQLNVKINELKENSEEAVLNQDYKEAGKLKLEIETIQKKHDELTNEFNKQPPKPVFNEVDVTVRCLDILIGMLSLPKLRTLTISLRTCNDEFLRPLFKFDNNEINYKLFKCLSLLCTLDKAVAQQYLKLMCTPLFLYRVTPHDNMQTLLISIATISDLLRLFGLDLLKNDGLDDSAANKSSRHRHNGTRRLYTIEQSGATESIDNLITSENIFDILLELMDDEQAELRNQAARALSELVMAKITLSPTIISRMILKWLLSALEEREEVKLQQIIGNALFYLMNIEEGGEIYERTIIPVLNCLGNAPRTSPVADVDVDNAVTFLATLTNVQGERQFVNIHKNLAYSLCYKIRDKVDDKNVPLYIRMLAALHLNLDNPCNVRELIDQVEGILEKITDKLSRKYLEKFLLKLKQMLNEEDKNDEPVDKGINEDNEQNKENSSVNHQIRNSSESPMVEQPNERLVIERSNDDHVAGPSNESPVAENSNKRSVVRHSNEGPAKRKANKSLVTVNPIGSSVNRIFNKSSESINSSESSTTVSKTASVTKKGKGKTLENSNERMSLRRSESNNSLVADLLTTAKKGLQSRESSRASGRLTQDETDISPPGRKNKQKNTKKRVQHSPNSSVSSSQVSDELNTRKSFRLSQNNIVLTPSPTISEVSTKKRSKRAERNVVNIPSREEPKSTKRNSKNSKGHVNNPVNTVSQEAKSTRKNSKSTNNVNTPNVRISERLNNKTPRTVHNNNFESDTPQVKRRKKRGRYSGNCITSIGSRYLDETILHTIVHDDEEKLYKLEDDDDEDHLSILTPTTTSSSQSSFCSTRSKTSRLVAVTETSSDSEPPRRKSSRKIKRNSKYETDDRTRKNHGKT